MHLGPHMVGLLVPQIFPKFIHFETFGMFIYLFLNILEEEHKTKEIIPSQGSHPSVSLPTDPLVAINLVTDKNK